MLKYNELEKLIKIQFSGFKEFAPKVGISKNTLYNRFEHKNFKVSEVEQIAKCLGVDFFSLFDEKKLSIAQEPEERYSNCPECEIKEKRIIELTNEIYECQKKYIDCLELLKEKKSAVS